MRAPREKGDEQEGGKERKMEDDGGREEGKQSMRFGTPSLWHRLVPLVSNKTPDDQFLGNFGLLGPWFVRKVGGGRGVLLDYLNDSSAFFSSFSSKAKGKREGSLSGSRP